MSDSSAAPLACLGSPSTRDVTWAEFTFCLLLVVAGVVFLGDAVTWGSSAYVGGAQYGDAEFWWNGALHFSQGIIADNPNLTYRMGYAAFAGSLAAVFGPDYRVFHLILVILFLVTTCGLYFGLRARLGRPAAGIAAMLLVFNPYTAEWLAISCSDGLGMLFNLLAMLALIAGLANPHDFRWLAAFGVLFACNSLTRPLMTPFIGPAMLVVCLPFWGKWKSMLRAMLVLVVAFATPTLGWMAFMWATTGNFALTGSSQDSSAFYAASDPSIQVWQGSMYDHVRESAAKHHQVDAPTPAQINAEFWILTRKNYREYWRYHSARLWQNLTVLAAFSPNEASQSTITLKWFRWFLKLALVAALVTNSVGKRSPGSIGVLLGIGVLWIAIPAMQSWLVLAGCLAAISSLWTSRREPFVWTAFWLVGTFALFLTGGVWGPPVSTPPSFNALGYRLGFQYLFSGDLVIALALASIGRHRPDKPVCASAGGSPFFRPAAPAKAIIVNSARTIALALGTCLFVGGSIVIWRHFVRTHTEKAPYPSPAAIRTPDTFEDARIVTNIADLRLALGQADGQLLLTNATSSSFVWNLPGQDRAVLLLYQQEAVRPIELSPRWFHAEVAQHLDVGSWMNRQGAWLLRSYRDDEPPHNLPYYINSPAIRAFVPLLPDQSGFDLKNIVRFPVAKYASQLTASGELTFSGLHPAWSLNSGTMKYPRRFAAISNDPSGTGSLRFDLRHARGQRRLSFAVQLESPTPNPARATLRVTTNSAGASNVRWDHIAFSTDGGPTAVGIQIPAEADAVELECDVNDPQSQLWFYELVLQADDFTY